MTLHALTWAAGFSLFCNLMLLAPVLYTLQVFDRVLASRSIPTMMLLLIGVAVAMAAMFVVDLVRAQVLAIQAEKVDAYLAPLVLRARALDRQDQPAGASPSDLAALRALMAGQGLIALFDLPWLLLFIGVIAVMHPLLGALAAAGAVAILGLAIAAERSGRAAREAYKSAATQSELQFRSIIGQSDAVRAMQMADGLVQAWMSTEGTARGWHRSLVSGSARLGAFGRLLRQAMQVLMMSAGAALVVTDRASPGVMVAVTILFGKAIAPAELLIANWGTWLAARDAWRRLAATWHADVAWTAAASPRPGNGAMSVANVTVRVPERKQSVLTGVSFELASGRALGLIGPSGCGKTTLARTLAGCLAPSEGHVLLGGRNIATSVEDGWASAVGYLAQIPVLLPGTIEQNVGRFQDGRDAQDVVEALRSAGAQEIADALPNGALTPVGPGGAALSFGQSQRICLARAVCGWPSLVVLDEPDAGLDAAGEAQLQRLLAELKRRGTTVVVATHRVNLILAMDDLLLLQDGRPVLFGPMEAVRRRISGASGEARA